MYSRPFLIQALPSFFSRRRRLAAVKSELIFFVKCSSIKILSCAELWRCHDLLCSENFRSDSTIGEADYERRMDGTCCLLQTMTCQNVPLLYVQSQFFMTEVDEDFDVAMNCSGSVLLTSGLDIQVAFIQANYLIFYLII